MHACSKCGCTVFTLERPKSNIGGHAINTGIKLATCMECGSQDRPHEVVQKTQQWKTEYKAEALDKTEQLLAKWLRSFEYYARGGTNDDGYRRK